jgi:AraC-like DNA-binding protein
MTVDANLLTKHATDDASGQPLTYPVRDLRIFLDALKRLGYNLASLTLSAGLKRFDLEDPDLRIPCEAFGALFGRAMQERPMKNLGVRMAAETTIGAFPLLDYLVVTSNTVGEGVKQLAHYFRLVGTPIHFDVREDEEPIRVIARAGNDTSLAIEFTVSLTVFNLRKEAGLQLTPEWVSFAHKPDDVSEIEQLLGCPVRAEASWSGLAFSKEAWQLPFRRRDPLLRALLERQADEIIARLPTQDGVAFDVRRALAKRIAGGDTRISSVARDLATTARTLQRRLAEAGLSYQELVELTRREAAEKYLADSSLTIAEVSYLLGYSEPSALHRAFKRWNRTTPQAFRQKQHADGARSHVRASD